MFFCFFYNFGKNLIVFSDFSKKILIFFDFLNFGKNLNVFPDFFKFEKNISFSKFLEKF